MILVDANLFVYAHVANFPQHETARKWQPAENHRTGLNSSWLVKLVHCCAYLLMSGINTRLQDLDPVNDPQKEFL